MSLQELALQSGLGFSNFDDSDPKWDTKDWPPFWGGTRNHHASVVLVHPDKKTEAIVVIGGRQNLNSVDSVLLLNVGEETKKWREGPPLKVPRSYHAAVVCNGGVYAIGGYGGRNALDTIERIDVEDLLRKPSTNNSKKWTTLKCRLSTERDDWPGAAAVHNRFIVVAGGRNRASGVLSSVDIIDTTVKDQHTVIAGPSLSVPRTFCGMSVIGHCLYVVGGHNNRESLNSVEYLEFSSDHNDTMIAQSIFPSSSTWTIHSHLVLSQPRYQHAITTVGSCLIIAGGCNKSSGSVEVLDSKNNVVWPLPPLTQARRAGSMVALTNEIVAFGGYDLDTCESLPLIDMKVQLMNSYSCRAELEEEIENLHMTMQRANMDGINVHELKEAAKAELLLPLVESLCNHEKFRTVRELQDEIKKLEVQMRESRGFRERVPIAEHIQNLQNLNSRNGDAGCDTKRPGRRSQAVNESEECRSSSASSEFYRKLVSIDDESDDILFKVHDAALLIYNVHHLKIFCTFLNHLYRSSKVHAKDWHRYTVKALKQTARRIDNMDHVGRAIFGLVVNKCRRDGIKFDANMVKHPVSDSSSCRASFLNIDIRTELAKLQILQEDNIPRSSVTSKSNEAADAYLQKVKSLGGPLREMLEASFQSDDQTVAVAMNIAILQALSFDHYRNEDAGHPTISQSVLCQVVDFVDLSHICFVVDQIGDERLNAACRVGRSIIERAGKTSSERDGAVKRIDLVTALGLLAHETRKLKQCAGHDEAVTLMALMVTVGMIHSLEDDYGGNDRKFMADGPSNDGSKFGRFVHQSPSTKVPSPVLLRSDILMTAEWETIDKMKEMILEHNRINRQLCDRLIELEQFCAQHLPRKRKVMIGTGNHTHSNQAGKCQESLQDDMIM